MSDFSRHPALRHWFEYRRVCVIGLGKSGLAAARLLRRLGARVGVTEKRSRREVSSWVRQLPASVRCETGGHRLLKENWDLIVVSPGVPSDLWTPLAEAGVPVWGELELGYRVLTLSGRLPDRIAAVTGTNGKTTTTALLGAIFRADGERTVVAGNIGTPLCSVLDLIAPSAVLVLEVSSYQLEACHAFRPRAGTVLNVTPDHLGRHRTMERYAREKFRLFQSQTPADAAVLNSNDAWCRRLGNTAPGRVFWFGRKDIRSEGKKLKSLIPGSTGAWNLPRYLPGRHNVENVLAAIGCARLLGASAGAIARALDTFRGVEHRLEHVRALRGVDYVNDSKATNVDSTFVALQALSGPLHVILGGEDKGAPYTPLIPLLKKKAKRILLIGEAAKKIELDLDGAVPVSRVHTLSNAVKQSAKEAVAGDTVLLSPACASFDQFDNFEHRGRAFKALVDAL